MGEDEPYIPSGSHSFGLPWVELLLVSGCVPHCGDLKFLFLYVSSLNYCSSYTTDIFHCLYLIGYSFKNGPWAYPTEAIWIDATLLTSYGLVCILLCITIEVIYGTCCSMIYFGLRTVYLIALLNSRSLLLVGQNTLYYHKYYYKKSNNNK